MNGRIVRLLPLILVFLLPISFLIPFSGGFFYNAGSSYTDMAISHYPNMLWLQRSIQKYGQIPLWSPLILSGTPSTANPLSGLHYPFGWIALLFPLPFGLNLTAMLHLIFGGIGMYFFLRRESFDQVVAATGAVAYEAMPKIFAHFGAGHLTLIYAVAWGPWLLLAQQSANHNMRRFWMIPGIVLGIIFLADPRYAAIAGILWAGYIVQWLLAKRHEYHLHYWIRLGGQVAATIVISLGLGAVLLLPMLEYVGLSTRSMLTPRDFTTLSLPPVQLLGMLVPNLAGSFEWEMYPGAAVISLAMIAVFLPGRKKLSFFWGFFFILAVLWSLGNNIPGLLFVSQLPGLNLLRVPPRMMLAGFTGLIMLACHGFRNILVRPSSLSEMPKINPLIFLVGMDFFLVLLSLAIGITNQAIPWKFAWGAVSLGVTLIVISLFKSSKIGPALFGFLIVASLMIDTTGTNFFNMKFQPAGIVLSEGGEAAREIADEKSADPFRIYSPSYSIPQQTAAFWGLELADGIDPLQLISYSKFMNEATGVPSDGYSVTLPAFSSGDPAIDNASYHPNAKLLGLLNVRFIVSDFPVETQGLNFIGKFQTAYLYQNGYELPRAWLQDPDAPLGEGIRPVSLVVRTANNLNYTVQGPGLLIASELYYPGWKAYIDDQEAPIQPVAGLFRGVELPNGQHEVRMVFRPVTFTIGLGVSLLSGFACLVAYLVSRKRIMQNET